MAPIGENYEEDCVFALLANHYVLGKWWIDASLNMSCLRWIYKNKDFCLYTEQNDDDTYSQTSSRGRSNYEIKSSNREISCNRIRLTRRPVKPRASAAKRSVMKDRSCFITSP